MFDAKQLLNDFLGSNVPGTGTNLKEGAGKVTQLAKDNPLATGAIAAVLLGTGTGRDFVGSGLKLGGMAAIAGLAYTAYKRYQNGEDTQQAATGDQVLPAPSDSAFAPERAPQGEDEFALTLVRAMIAAAKADGHIDADERARIFDRLQMSGMGEDAQAFIAAELDDPSSMDQLVDAAQTDAQRVELYTASRLTIDPKTRAERGYLDMLAGRLQLPDGLIDHIESTVAGAAA